MVGNIKKNGPPPCLYYRSGPSVSETRLGSFSCQKAFSCREMHMQEGFVGVTFREVSRSGPVHGQFPPPLVGCDSL